MKDTPRLHIITPRGRPNYPGLDVLYDGIMAIPPEPGRGKDRVLFYDDLHRLHQHWQQAMKMLERMGCVEWTISRESSDLPARRRIRFRRPAAP